MPIIPKMYSYDKEDTVYEMPVVTFEQPRAWLDQNLGCWVVGMCRLNDWAGRVYLADSAEPVPKASYFKDKMPIAEILPGLKFEMDIVDFEGERCRLVLQHEFPNGQINSLN